MNVYIKLLIVFIIGFLLLNLPPTLEPFFLFKIYFGSSFADLEMDIIRILNISGLLMVIYTVIMVFRNIIKGK